MKHEKHCPFRYDDGDGTCLDCEAIRVAVAAERERIPISLIADLMAGLSVPASLGVLGAAYAPWGKLREHWKLFGYQSSAEIAAAIREQQP